MVKFYGFINLKYGVFIFDFGKKNFLKLVMLDFWDLGLGLFLKLWYWVIN